MAADLVVVVLAMEERLLEEDHAGQHAAETPHVQTVVVHLRDGGTNEGLVLSARDFKARGRARGEGRGVPSTIPDSPPAARGL